MKVFNINIYDDVSQDCDVTRNALPHQPSFFCQTSKRTDVFSADFHENFDKRLAKPCHFLEIKLQSSNNDSGHRFASNNQENCSFLQHLLAKIGALAMTTFNLAER